MGWNRGLFGGAGIGAAEVVCIEKDPGSLGGARDDVQKSGHASILLAAGTLTYWSRCGQPSFGKAQDRLSPVT